MAGRRGRHPGDRLRDRIVTTASWPRECLSSPTPSKVPGIGARGLPIAADGIGHDRADAGRVALRRAYVPVPTDAPSRGASTSWLRWDTNARGGRGSRRRVPAGSAPCPMIPDTPAYVIHIRFERRTEGRVVPHRAWRTSGARPAHATLTAADCAAVSSLAFDASVEEIFPNPLGRGCGRARTTESTVDEDSSPPAGAMR